MAYRNIVSTNKLCEVIQRQGTTTLLLYNLSHFEFYVASVTRDKDDDELLAISSATQIDGLMLEDISKENGTYIHYVDQNSLFNQTNTAYVIIDLGPQFQDEVKAFIKQNKGTIGEFGNLTLDDNEYGLLAYAYVITDKSPNLMAWFMRNALNTTHLPLMTQIVAWAKRNGAHISKLKKKTITAYNGFSNIQCLYDEVKTVEGSLLANSVSNMFNTEQKRILKATALTSRQIFLMRKFNRLSPLKRNNFIRKVSTINDIDEIMRQMSLLVKDDFGWGYDSFMAFLKQNDDLHYEIMWDTNDVVVLKINDYDTIKCLAKTTNWCISKNKSYWDRYTSSVFSHGTQFVVFNFNKAEDDELSIVGFTIDENGSIFAAHSFSNQNMWHGWIDSRIETSFDDRKLSISKMLKGLCIPYSDWTDSREKAPILKDVITRSNALPTIDDIVGGNEAYDVISNTSNHLVIKTRNLDILKLFNEDGLPQGAKEIANSKDVNCIELDELAPFPSDIAINNLMCWLFIKFSNSDKEECANVYVVMTSIINSHNEKILYSAYDFNEFGQCEMPRNQHSYVEAYNPLIIKLIECGILPHTVGVIHEKMYIRLLACALRDGNLPIADKLLQNQEFLGLLRHQQRDKCPSASLLPTSISMILFTLHSLDPIYILYKRQVPLQTLLLNDGVFELVSNLATFALTFKPTLCNLDMGFINKTDMDDFKTVKGEVNGYIYGLKMILSLGDWPKYQNVLKLIIKNCFGDMRVNNVSVLVFNLLFNCLTCESVRDLTVNSKQLMQRFLPYVADAKQATPQMAMAVCV